MLNLRFILAPVLPANSSPRLRRRIQLHQRLRRHRPLVGLHPPRALAVLLAPGRARDHPCHGIIPPLELVPCLHAVCAARHPRAGSVQESAVLAARRRRLGYLRFWQALLARLGADPSEVGQLCAGEAGRQG